MNDFTWSGSTCSIPDRLRSTSYARLQQCRTAHPPVADENADSNEWLRRLEGRATARMAQYERDRQDLEREEFSVRMKASATPRSNPIPQPEPECRSYIPRGTRWTCASKGEMFVTGVTGFLLGFGGAALVDVLLTRLLR